MAKDVEGNDKSYMVTFRANGPMGALNADGTAPDVSRSILLACDYFTVEPSGAVTFWVRSPDGERSALIAAYGKEEWSSVSLAS